MMNLTNPYVIRILIATRKVDSINNISKRISLSYGWTHKWISELAKISVFRLTRTKLYLNEDNYFYKKTIRYITDINKDVSFCYEVLGLFGIDYCFTKTDAVFIWTKGGYNIARFRDFYPIFIKVKNRDKKIFEEYCKKLSLNINKKRGIFYNVIFLDDFRITYSNNIPVDSLEDTMSFMKKNIYNFQPALEMIKEMYGEKINVKYKEVLTNV